eukprot:374395-Amphidinium_carterae.1
MQIISLLQLWFCSEASCCKQLEQNLVIPQMCRRGIRFSVCSNVRLSLLVSCACVKAFLIFLGWNMHYILPVSQDHQFAMLHPRAASKHEVGRRHVPQISKGAL